MPCQRDAFQWWIPLAVSASIVFVTICFGILRWILKIYLRHRRYHYSVNLTRRHSSINYKDSDRRRNVSLQSGNGDEYLDESLDDLSGPEDIDFESDTDSDDIMAKSFDVYAKRQSNVRKSRTIDVKPCLVDKNINKNMGHPKFYLSDPPKHVKILNGKLPVETKEQNILPEEAHPTEWRRNKRFEWLCSWLRHSRLGMSARQQLNMKLYCERFTTVSYPAGKIMVNEC